MGWLRRLFGAPRRVEAHTLGILDLSGGTARALMAADRAALGPLFRRVSESTDVPPRSTLLLVYCTIASDGAILDARANLVMTLDRKGNAFAHLFPRLVADMKSGTSMPRAWVKLAPQAPRTPHVDCPDAIFACELAPLAFS